MAKVRKKDKTCISSMIPSARPTIPQGAITILTCTLFDLRDFENWGQTDVRTPRVKIVITTGRDCGSAAWINYNFVSCSY